MGECAILQIMNETQINDKLSRFLELDDQVMQQ